MADEPERPIEKLLRACAKKRRDEASDSSALELHPATRRLLQGEVARRFGRGERQGRTLGEWVALLRPRLAEGLVIIALTGVLAAVMLPSLGKSKNKATLAKNEPAPVAPPMAQVAPMPAPPPPPAAAVAASEASAPLVAAAEADRMQRDKEVRRLAVEETAAQKDLAKAPASRIAPDAKEASGAVFADASEKKQELPMFTAAQSQAALGAMAKSKAAASLVQRFSQVIPTEAKGGALRKAESPVLVSFQVEQAGRELRVVDSDGSVYAGYVQPAAAAPGTRVRRGEKAALAKPATAPARNFDSGVMADAVRPGNEAYFFRVSGTNRSLKQPVIFAGSLLSMTNSVVLGHASGGAGDGLGGFQATPVQPAPALLLNSRISGKVTIGTGKEIEINAMPTKP